jgi:hypothetical protein
MNRNMRKGIEFPISREMLLGYDSAAPKAIVTKDNRRSLVCGSRSTGAYGLVHNSLVVSC